jgi:Protein of unknown function (DUF3892)
MAAKWADYLITAVSFNASGTHIEAVQIYPDEGDKVGSASQASRVQVVAWLESGYTFCTAISSGGKWHMGASVKIVIIDNQQFIKSKADSSKFDNLDNLPTF